MTQLYQDPDIQYNTIQHTSKVNQQQQKTKKQAFLKNNIFHYPTPNYATKCVCVCIPIPILCPDIPIPSHPNLILHLPIPSLGCRSIMWYYISPSIARPVSHPSIPHSFSGSHPPSTAGQKEVAKQEAQIPPFPLPSMSIQPIFVHLKSPFPFQVNKKVRLF